MRHEAISVSMDLERFSADFVTLRKAAPQILARGLNRAGLAGKTAMVRAVATESGIRNKDISRVISVHKAKSNDLTWSLTLKGNRIPLIAFQARGPEPSAGRGRGVSWRMMGQKKSDGSLFISTVGKGQHRGVFRRAASPERKSKGARGFNLPIKEQFGPSIPHVAEKQVPVFEASAGAALEKTILHEIEWTS